MSDIRDGRGWTWSRGVSFKVSRQFKLDGESPSHSSGGFTLLGALTRILGIAGFLMAHDRMVLN